MTNRGEKSHRENKDACSFITETEAVEEYEVDKGENERSNEAGDLGWLGKKWKTENE